MLQLNCQQYQFVKLTHNIEIYKKNLKFIQIDYITEINSGQIFELINPYTGIVKAAIEVNIGYNNSFYICTTNEILIKKDISIMKIKITKQN